MGIEDIRRIKSEAGVPKQKKPYRIPKQSEKKKQQLALSKEMRGDEDTEQLAWYKMIQPQLTGRCCRCNAKYNHTILKYAIMATAHILAKRKEMFPSVATHPLNFLELPPFCGCHHWYDNQATWEEIKASNIWPIIKERFIMMEPDIKERNKIPDIFLPLIQSA